MISDAGSLLEDAGAWLSDAGADMSDAGSAQGQEVISVPCDTVYERTEDFGDRVVKNRSHFAFIPGTEGVRPEDLGSMHVALCDQRPLLDGSGCPDGAQCSGSAAPEPTCILVRPSIYEGMAGVGCGSGSTNTQFGWDYDFTYTRILFWRD